MFLSRVVLMVFALFLCASTGGVAYAKEPRNLTFIKQDLVHYHDSGEYEKDIARVTQQAQAYLRARLNQHSNKKLAIVLDIDETSLSNYPDMVVLRFGGTLKEIDEAIGKGQDPEIQPTLKLYQFAKANHVAVFFVTARRENVRAATEANLEKAGYHQWDGIFFLPVDYHEKSVLDFKVGSRKKIIEQGYDIVLNVSDQNADLRGGYADKAFKLPNPFYLIP